MNNNYTVYIHVNKTNGKVYVGQTERAAQERWKNNGAGYKGQYFYSAIEQFGWDNFEHKIIAEHLTMAEAEQLEKDLIAKYRANNEEFGYNKTKGGFGSTGRAWTKEDREKASLVQKECWQEPGRKEKASEIQKELWRSEEGRAQRSAQAIQLWQNPEYREKLSGANHARSKPVICVTTGEVFPNARQASLWAQKANPQNIGKCCKGERAHAGIHPETGEKLAWQFYIAEGKKNEMD